MTATAALSSTTGYEERFVSTDYTKQATIDKTKPNVVRDLQGAINAILDADDALSGRQTAEQRTVKLKNGKQETLARLKTDDKYEERTHQFLGEVLDIIADKYPKAREVIQEARARSGTGDNGHLVNIDENLVKALQEIKDKGYLRGFNRDELIAKCDLEGIARLDIQSLLGADITKLSSTAVSGLVAAQVTGTQASLERYKGLRDSIKDIVAAKIEAIQKGGGRIDVGELQREIGAALQAANITVTEEVGKQFTSPESPIIKTLKDYEAAVAASRDAKGGDPKARALALVTEGKAFTDLQTALDGLPKPIVEAINAQIKAEKDKGNAGKHNEEVDLALVEAGCVDRKAAGVVNGVAQKDGGSRQDRAR